MKKPRKPRARKPICPSGHDKLPENIYTDKQGGISCKVCRYEQLKKRRVREKELNLRSIAQLQSVVGT